MGHLWTWKTNRNAAEIVSLVDGLSVSVLTKVVRIRQAASMTSLVSPATPHGSAPHGPCQDLYSGC